jgi:MinD superfamily P-loop ATPase
MPAFEITVLSGKGGTGKTSLTAAFARLAGPAALCDLDVDASNLPLLLPHQVREEHPFESGFIAVFDRERCRDCGRCLTYCRFDAFSEGEDGIDFDPTLCEGCGVCARFCRAGALIMQPRRCGVWYASETETGPLLHARLDPGAENSGKLIARLRQEAARLAAERGLPLILADGPPGIGCPAISSVGGSGFVVLVAEPTASGVADLVRAADLCAHFSVPAGIVLNKADLDAGRAAEIAALAAARGLPFLARIPFAEGAMRALVAGQTLLDVPQTAAAVKDAWQALGSRRNSQGQSK